MGSIFTDSDHGNTSVPIRTKDLVIGNTYTLSLHSSPFKLVRCMPSGNMIGNYSSKEYPITARGYVYQTTEQANQTKENTMTKLYEINTNGVSTYGAKLAVNSSGDWVMELKGTGAVVSVPKENVKEVLPYSVEVEFTQGKAGQHSYLARKEDWAVGDLVIIQDTSGVARVIKVNSASRSASKWITGVKLQGSFITAGE